MTEIAAPSRENHQLAELSWDKTRTLYDDIAFLLKRQTPKPILPGGAKANTLMSFRIHPVGQMSIDDQFSWAHKDAPLNPKDFAALPPEVQQEMIDNPMFVMRIPTVAGNSNEDLEIFSCVPSDLDREKPGIYGKLLFPILDADHAYQEEIKLNPDIKTPVFAKLAGTSARLMHSNEPFMQQIMPMISAQRTLAEK